LSDISALKALSIQSKACIIINEFEARRMPMFQLRAVLEMVTINDEEKKIIIDMVEAELRANKHPAEKVGAFLSDLISNQPTRHLSPSEANVRSTRALRLPFSLGFETTPPSGNTILRGKTTGGAPVLPVSPMITDGPPPPRDMPLPPRDAPVSLPPPLPPPIQIPIPTAASAPLPAPASQSPLRNTQRRVTFVFETKADTPHNPAATPPRGTLIFNAKPVPEPEAAPPAAAPPNQDPMQPILATGVIVLADDDRRARMLFRMRLEQAGFTIAECNDGAEAWTRLQKGDVAAIVMDMKMPNLHGLDLLARIASQMNGLPVVICSAYDQLEDELVVQKYPRLKYLVKPIMPEKLIEAIKELLADGVKKYNVV